MFSEPQSITVNTVGSTLPRVSFGDRDGVFENTTDGHRLRISHTVVSKSRNRRVVRLDTTKTAADPLLDGVSRQYVMSAYLVIDHPLVGFDPASTEDNVQALVDWLAVAGNLTKVVNGES